MGLEQEGEWGLRLRLRMALEVPQTYANVAFLLDVDEQLLRDYIGNPNFVLENADYLTILNGLPNLPLREHVRGTGGQYQIEYYEKPLWSLDDVMSLENAFGATKAAVFYQQEAYPERVATFGPDDLDVFTVQQIIDAAVGEDLERLITVVWYEPVERFPYTPRV